MIAIPLAWAGILFWHLSPEWIVLLVKLDMPLKSLVGLYYVLKTDWIHNLTRNSTNLEETEI
jgi:Na+-driven multidrug efflux pump